LPLEKKGIPLKRAGRMVLMGLALGKVGGGWAQLGNGLKNTSEKRGAGPPDVN